MQVRKFSGINSHTEAFNAKVLKLTVTLKGLTQNSS